MNVKSLKKKKKNSSSIHLYLQWGGAWENHSNGHIFAIYSSENYKLSWTEMGVIYTDISISKFFSRKIFTSGYPQKAENFI